MSTTSTDPATFDERVLLGVLTEEPRHFTVDELALELGGDIAAVRVDDALSPLQRAGLAHRHDSFAFASRAARRARELDPV